jgi:hypothetical protein
VRGSRNVVVSFFEHASDVQPHMLSRASTRKIEAFSRFWHVIIITWYWASLLNN